MQVLAYRPCWHLFFIMYIGSMLATPEWIFETTQQGWLRDAIAQSGSLPIYRRHGMFLEPELDRLPILTKKEMREGFPDNFLPQASLDDLLSKSLVELEHTSGTSEERLPVFFERGWWDRQEAKALRMNESIRQCLEGVQAPRRATLTAPSCNGLTCPTVWMSREQRTIGGTLFVNLARIPFLLTPSELQRMAREIMEWEPTFLDLDPVHGTRFALYCEKEGIRFPSVKFILTSYEFTSVVHRRILSRVFQVPVWNLYGSTETGHLLMETVGGLMRPSVETAFLELEETDDQGVGPLLVTTLSNAYMPLVRYRIGDLAQRVGSPYASHYRIHGRTRDALRSRDGRRVTTLQIDECLSGLSGVAHYELRQEKTGHAVFRYVPDSAPPPDGELNEAIEQISALLGMPVEMVPASTLVPAASGKFRLTIPAA